MDMRCPVAARTVMSLFETYARLSALLSLRSFQFAEPVPGTGMPQHLGFCFNAEELKKPSKTGEYDCTVLLDLERQEWMSQVLLELRRQSGENGLLFPIGYAELSRLFKRAVLKAGVKVLEPTLYTLRHGGASHDCGAKVRCRSTIKARGAWRADSSLRRYEKHGRITLQLRKLPGAVLQALLRRHSLGENAFARRCLQPLRSRAPM